MCFCYCCLMMSTIEKLATRFIFSSFRNWTQNFFMLHLNNWHRRSSKEWWLWWWDITSFNSEWMLKSINIYEQTIWWRNRKEIGKSSSSSSWFEDRKKTILIIIFFLKHIVESLKKLLMKSRAMGKVRLRVKIFFLAIQVRWLLNVLKIRFAFKMMMMMWVTNSFQLNHLRLSHSVFFSNFFFSLLLNVICEFMLCFFMRKYCFVWLTTTTDWVILKKHN
jgi:hypothetical protein